MKNSKLYSLSVILLLSLFLSACGSAIGASSWPGITVDEESQSVYVAYNQHVYSLDAETGRESWRFPAEADNGTSFFASPVISGEDQLLIGGYDKILYSLNPQNNGRINWQFDMAVDRYIGSPLVTDEGVFAPNADGMLYGLSDQGQDNWSFDSGDALWASPTSDGDLIFLPSIDHNLYALSAQNGNVNWQQDLGGGIVGNAVLNEDGTLYVGTFGSEVVALNSSNGVIQWRTSTEAWVWGAPSFSDGMVFAADIEGNVYAFDAENGREVWLVSADGAITGSPLVANEHVYVSTENGQVMSIGIDGVIQWSLTVEGQAFSSPALAGELILIGLVEGEAVVVALDSNGNTVWSFVPQN